MTWPPLTKGKLAEGAAVPMVIDIVADSAVRPVDRDKRH